MTIGITFAWILGVGVLLIALLATSAHGGQGLTAVNALFGSIYALSTGVAVSDTLISLAVLLAVALAFRPLLFTTLDPELARLRGVRIRALGAGFLAVLALLVAAGTQAIGALLLLGLIAAPAGAAHQLTGRSRLGAALSALIAVGAVWAGLALSYAIAGLPPSTAIVGLAAVAYAMAAGARRLRRAPAAASSGSGSEEPAVTPSGSRTRRAAGTS